MYLRIWIPCLEYLAYSNSHCMHFWCRKTTTLRFSFVYCNGSSNSDGEAWRGELMKSSDQMCYRCSSILTAEEKTFCLFSHLSIEIDKVSSRVRKHLLCLHWFWSLAGLLAQLFFQVLKQLKQLMVDPVVVLLQSIYLHISSALVNGGIYIICSHRQICELRRLWEEFIDTIKCVWIRKVSTFKCRCFLCKSIHSMYKSW